MGWEGHYRQFEKDHPMDFSAFKANPSPGGPIEGEGQDEVGNFRFEGSFNNDGTKVRFVKEYIGKHKIYYLGNVTMNPPTIVGKWGFTAEKPEDDFKLWWT